jgi:hypothetical protein
LSLRRGTTLTCRSAITTSSCRNPNTSPILRPVSSNKPNSSRSRRCSQASRIACTCPAVITCALGTGAGKLIARRRCGADLLM